jgi:hypothetical protein
MIRERYTRTGWQDGDSWEGRKVNSGGKARRDHACVSRLPHRHRLFQVAIAVPSLLSSDRIGNSGRPYTPRASKSHADIYLRLSDTTEQVALECTPILVLDGITTCTFTLKNLVLPEIRHFTTLDPHKVTPADAGNNFFLERPSSIGKYRAKEAVRLLLELNDGVDGKADTRSLESVTSTEEGRTWIKSFSLVIAHNLDKKQLDELATLLWEDVRTAGFLAQFYFQYRKHESR